jgi:cytochrome c oxidase subunit 3
MGSKSQACLALIVTIVLAVIFTGLQGYEYVTAPFTISDGVYGASFYMATGFHGFHVIVGTCFLTVCLGRLYLNHFTKEHHFGFEAAAWYWHFVDVVWLFLFITIYWWGS